MAYKANTIINLPFIEIRKNPGDTITKKELDDARQSEEDIQRLVKSGAMEKA